MKPLIGQDTYNTWSAVMKRVLKAMGSYEINIQGIQPMDQYTTATVQAFNQQDNAAATAILQVVLEDILAQISHFDTSHAMWIYLQQQYLRESSYSCVAQIQKLISLASSQDLLPLFQSLS